MPSRKILSAFATIGLLITGSLMDSGPAEARSRHRARYKIVRHHQTYTPPYAAYVVDANTGRTLYAYNENELRHPASITKVMTLYMLFEQLEKGRFRLDSEITISAHAASMAPSKLGLRPGSTIEVEHAIKAVVTKSANDVAAAIGEAIGGTEERFAVMMTDKAHSLGMSRTHYENASGLPDPEQVTTARDLSILGRAIQERFPRQFGYFATHNFAYRGQVMRNHNHLLGRVEGVDGIKTGYTRASGFNLLTSARSGNRRIVSVVLGGRSGHARDQIMAGLVDKHLENASSVRTASNVSESPAERVETARNDTPERREQPVARAEPPKPIAITAQPITRQEPSRTLAFAAPTAAAAALAPSNSLVPPLALERPRPAVIAAATRTPDDKVATIPERRPVSIDGSTRAVSASAAPSATPGALRWIAGPQGQPAKPPLANVAQTQPLRPAEPIRTAKAEPARETTASKTEAPRPAAAKAGVMIQIGATDEAGKANELLTRAKSKNPALAGAAAFTEKVQKGSETLWRARFAGLSENQADAACKSLKRTGFACFATRN